LLYVDTRYAWQCGWLATHKSLGGSTTSS
jgi:hypothetical protein